MDLVPEDAVFVVFEGTDNSEGVRLPAVVESELLTITTPWQVKFQENRGAPASATFDKLASYTESSDTGIKYFSGTATYTNTFEINKNILKQGGQIILDLGSVKNLAEVYVNGQSMGTVWKKPFALDITEAVKAGKNEVEIKVVNLWVNRLIGDAQPDVKEKLTYTSMPFYNANSPLLPSGLLGPVKLINRK